MKSICLSMMVAVLLLSGCEGDLRTLEEAVESSELQLRSIAITPTRNLADPVYLNPGEQLQFRINATDTSGKSPAVSNADRRWAVSNGSVASINRFGKFVALGNGSVNVSVTIGGLVSAPYPVIVSDASLASLKTISGATSVSHCSENSYSVEGVFNDNSVRAVTGVRWTIPTLSAENNTAKIISTEGEKLLVGALAPGQFTLRATLETFNSDLPVSVAADLTALRIRSSPITVERGQTLSLLAQAERTAEAISRDTGVTRVVDWRVDATESIARISNTLGSEGRITGLRNGAGSVRAACGDIVFVSDLNVVEPVRIDTLDLDPNDNPLQIRLSSPNVVMTARANTSAGGQIDITHVANWSVTAGSEFLTVDNTGSVRGELTALSVGSATLQVSYRGVIKTINVNVVN